MKSLVIALSVLASQSVFATTLTGSAEEKCGGATARAICEKCKPAQKAKAASDALQAWKDKCDAECVGKNNPPTRCYERNPNNDPGAPSPTCEQLGNPATDEAWKAEVTKKCTCRRKDC